MRVSLGAVRWSWGRRMEEEREGGIDKEEGMWDDADPIAIVAVVLRSSLRM